MAALKPRVFIGSSTKSNTRKIVDHFRSHLSEFASVVPWTNLREFKTKNTTLASLIEAANTLDFAVLVLACDDKLRKGESKSEADAPRDNVVLELGIFLGAIGHDRVIPVMEQDGCISLPSDIGSSTTVPRFTTENIDLQAQSIAHICEDIKVRVSEYGRREIKIQLAHQWWYDTKADCVMVTLNGPALQRSRDVIGDRQLAIVGCIDSKSVNVDDNENIAVSELRTLPVELSDHLEFQIPASAFPDPLGPGSNIKMRVVMAPEGANLQKYKNLSAMWESGVHRLEKMSFSRGAECPTTECGLNLGSRR